MSDTAASYVQELSRALWFRSADSRCRFLFAPEDPNGLVIALLGPKGTEAITQAARRLVSSGRSVTSGAMLVDDGDAVFCLAGEPKPFLLALAGWVARHVAEIPALGTLKGAAAGRLPAPLSSEADIGAIDLDQLEITRDPAAWQAVLPVDDAGVAAILDGRMPGERMWFWMSNQVRGDMVPLLLQPVAWDPNRDRLDEQIRQLEADGAGDGVTGFAYAAEDGRFQFVSCELHGALMTELADWVRQRQDAHPALARLAHARFVLVQAGQVVEVIEAPGTWSGIVAPAAAGTLAAAAEALTALAPEASLWLWLTAQAPEGGFVALAPVTGDEDGAGFQAQVSGFYRRFPESYRDAATATVTRLGDGGLHIDWHGGGPGAAADGLTRAASREAGLRPLANAAARGGDA